MTEEPATIRIAFADAEENISTPVADFHTTQTGSGAKVYPVDRDALALPPMPATSLWVNENAKIVLQIKGDAADIVESEESNGFFPIILKNIKTGAITHRKLRLGDEGTKDFVGFNATGDITVNISTFVRLGSYTVPSGFMATLDAGQPVFCFIGDDT